jgi:hypothetical protein
MWIIGDYICLNTHNRKNGTKNTEKIKNNLAIAQKRKNGTEITWSGV